MAGLASEKLCIVQTRPDKAAFPIAFPINFNKTSIKFP